MPYPILPVEQATFTTIPTGGNLTTENTYPLISDQSPWVPLSCLVWDGTNLRPYILDWVGGTKNKPPTNVYTFFRSYCSTSSPPIYNVNSLRTSPQTLNFIVGGVNPTSPIGVNLDLYYNAILDTFWFKSSGSWELYGTSQKSLNQKFIIGSYLTPPNSLGINTSVYFNPYTQAIFVRDSNSYTLQGYLRENYISQQSNISDEVSAFVVETPQVKTYPWFSLPYRSKITRISHSLGAGTAVVNILAPTSVLTLNVTSSYTTLTSQNIIIPANTLISVEVSSPSLDAADLFLNFTLERL